MSNIQIDDCTVNVPLDHVRSELENNGYLVFAEYDYEDMADHLTTNDYAVFDCDADTNDYLEGAAASDVIVWLRCEWSDSDILAELDPADVAEFAESEGLTTGAPALSEVSIADLMAEVARRLERCEKPAPDPETDKKLQEARELGLYWQCEAERLMDEKPAPAPVTGPYVEGDRLALHDGLVVDMISRQPDGLYLVNVSGTEVNRTIHGTEIKYKYEESDG